MEYVQQRNIEKLTRFLDKGLDPNFHDPDTGGEKVGGKKIKSHPNWASCFYFNLLPLSFFFFLQSHFPSSSVFTTKGPCRDFLK